MLSTGTPSPHLLDLIITHFGLFLYRPILWPLSPQLSICQLLSGGLTRPQSCLPPLNRQGYAHLVLQACSLPQHMPLLSLIPSFFPPASRLVSPLIVSSVCPPCCLPSWPPLSSSNSITLPLCPSHTSLYTSTLEIK